MERKGKKIIIFFNLKSSDRRRDREISIYWFTPQKTAVVRDGWRGAGTEELALGLLNLCRSSRPWAILCCLPKQGAGLEVDRLGQELVPICEAGSAGRELVCSFTGLGQEL